MLKEEWPLAERPKPDEVKTARVLDARQFWRCC
jgi:hypothetical protein